MRQKEIDDAFFAFGLILGSFKGCGDDGIDKIIYNNLTKIVELMQKGSEVFRDLQAIKTPDNFERVALK